MTEETKPSFTKYRVARDASMLPSTVVVERALVAGRGRTGRQADGSKQENDCMPFHHGSSVLAWACVARS